MSVKADSSVLPAYNTLCLAYRRRIVGLCDHCPGDTRYMRGKRADINMIRLTVSVADR